MLTYFLLASLRFRASNKKPVDMTGRELHGAMPLQTIFAQPISCPSGAEPGGGHCPRLNFSFEIIPLLFLGTANYVENYKGQQRYRRTTREDERGRGKPIAHHTEADNGT